MVLLDGKKLAYKIRQKFKRRILMLKRQGITPGLAVILVGNNSASQIYVHNKQLLCDKLGIKFYLKKFESGISNDILLREIKKLNKNAKIHGIILQLPVPKKINAFRLILTINSAKDVDGLNPINLGLLATGHPMFLPATPKGIIDLLDNYQIKLKGKHVVLVGFGQVVGMPLSLLLAHRQATVTITHDATNNLKNFTKMADILITATGHPSLIKGSMVKKGVVVVDAGITKVGDKFVGDVDFVSVNRKASYITPVPGGVGPMTVSSLIDNVIKAANNFRL